MIVVTVLGGGLTVGATLGIVLPRIEPLWLSRRAALTVQAYEGRTRTPIAAVGYQEPSLVFALGTDLKLLGSDEASRFFVAHPNALIWWVSSDHRDAFETAADSAGLRLREVAAVDGWNLVKGRKTRLVLFERGG
jgi:hypothetical protein